MSSYGGPLEILAMSKFEDLIEVADDPVLACRWYRIRSSLVRRIGDKLTPTVSVEALSEMMISKVGYDFEPTATRMPRYVDFGVENGHPDTNSWCTEFTMCPEWLVTLAAR